MITIGDSALDSSAKIETLLFFAVMGNLHSGFRQFQSSPPAHHPQSCILRVISAMRRGAASNVGGIDFSLEASLNTPVRSNPVVQAIIERGSSDERIDSLASAP
jgi:hypothetical protein